MHSYKRNNNIKEDYFNNKITTKKWKYRDYWKAFIKEFIIHNYNLTDIQVGKEKTRLFPHKCQNNIKIKGITLIFLLLLFKSFRLDNHWDLLLFFLL